MKILYLLRHAKAASGDAMTDDAGRPLSPRGFEACDTMGTYMRAKQYQPSLVLSSPSLRTRQTCERLLQAAQMSTPVRLIQSLYLATAGTILYAVQDTPDEVNSVMIVGHNPGMHHAAMILASPKRDDLRQTLELKYPTGALAVLQFDVKRWREVAPGIGELTDFATPGSV